MTYIIEHLSAGNDRFSRASRKLGPVRRRQLVWKMRLRGEKHCRDAPHSRMVRRPTSKRQVAGISWIAAHSKIQPDQVLPRKNGAAGQVGSSDVMKGGPSHRSSRCARIGIPMSGVHRRFMVAALEGLRIDKLVNAQTDVSKG